MTTIKDICNEIKFNDIQRAIEYHYPEDKNSYISCYDFIKTCVAKEICTEKLEIRAWNNSSYPNRDDNDEDYYDVGTDDEYGVSGRPWEDLSNLEISKDTLKHYTYPEIVAHFIWEITFYGNQAETQEIFEDIKNTMEKYDIGNLK